MKSMLENRAEPTSYVRAREKKSLTGQAVVKWVREVHGVDVNAACKSDAVQNAESKATISGMVRGLWRTHGGAHSGGGHGEDGLDDELFFGYGSANE